MKKFTDIFQRGLIVSCQAREGEPLFGSNIMARMAKAAELGGAIGIRANSPPDIRAIKEAVPLPIIGIYKINTEGFDVYITPTFESARAVADAGADVIAIDGTGRARPNGETLESLIRRIHKEPGVPVMADCSTLAEGVNAVRAGADAVATTLAGYTSYTRETDSPDFELLAGLIKNAGVPVIAEGGYRYPAQAGRALKMGAYAVVVGSAVTRPHKITARFVKEMKPYLTRLNLRASSELP